ncbi:ribosome silencing factor [Ottowia sp.]|uniref:ribosome silencing factor n=1 Tax=Ottowia sp. TaxID=1898956 RepID=UPI003A854A1C
MSEASAKKDIQKLQRAIVDGLEDVKAHDIRVFNTEHLSPLFERVMVASGTSNRQTKALAASVRDKVREAGFAKPRIEGEDNGEWIIVDCGPAVCHIMQPVIRQYYNLEEIWGEKPVRLKGSGAAAKASRKPVARKATAKKAAQTKAAQTQAAPKHAIAPQKPPTKSASKKAVPAKKSGAARKAAPGRSQPDSRSQRGGGKPTTKSVIKPAAKSSVKSPARKAASRKPA